jgi:hypothetical protein
MTDLRHATLYLAAGTNRVIVFNPGGYFDGWICEWENGPHSTLRPLRQLDKVPLPPGFDIAEALIKHRPVPKPVAPPKSRAPSKPKDETLPL